MPLGAFRIKRLAWFDSGSGRRLRGNVRIQRNAWFDSGSGDDFLVLVVLSAMLGSTVALGVYWW